MQKTSVLGNSLIWFGAAVSIAEILTGALMAQQGFVTALTAILAGHLVGCTLLFFAGWIGAKHHVSAMEAVKCSFGTAGGGFFAILNLTQLLGWSAVMIAAGAYSAHGIHPLPPWAWAILTGGLIAVWLLLKTKELKILNTLAVALLFALTIVLGAVILRERSAAPAVQKAELSFGDALELATAMPLSWLPLIADYTCNSSRPKLVSALSAGVYFATSCWMFFIGLCAALYAGSDNITLILRRAGLGIPALLIVVLSTVTTTYLDVFSSEMSVQSMTGKIPGKVTGFAVCIAGVLLAVFCETGAFESFLYFIGSVFAPMIAIQITDFFILKKADAGRCRCRVSSLVIWGLGLILYRILLARNPVCGSTVPVMLFTALLRIGYHKISHLHR